MAHIEQVGYFIFDLSNSKPKFMKFRQYFIQYYRKFHKFTLKTAKFESKTANLLNVGSKRWEIQKKCMSLDEQVFSFNRSSTFLASVHDNFFIP